MECCLNAKLTISNDVHAKVSVDNCINGSMGVGTVVIRDGTNDYQRLMNKPSINSVELVGNKTFPQLGLTRITEHEIDEMIYG